MTAYQVGMKQSPVRHRTTFQKVPVDILVTPSTGMTRMQLATLVAQAVAELRLAEVAFTDDPLVKLRLRGYAVQRAADVFRLAGLTDYAVVCGDEVAFGGLSAEQAEPVKVG